MLAWDEPLLEKGSNTYVVLKYSDILFTFLFLAELVMKVSLYVGDGGHPAIITQFILFLNHLPLRNFAVPDAR